MTCGTIVQDLRDLLEEHENWTPLLEASLQEAKNKAVAVSLRGADKLPDSLPLYFNYLDALVKWRPVQSYPREIFDALATYYWLLDQPTGRELQTHEEFRAWMVQFAKDWGCYLNTTGSIDAETIRTFEEDPTFALWQYERGPSGWLTFNQFFARQIKPGLRPVAGMYDDRIVTSPADCTFKQKFKIDDDSEITVKYTHKYKILDLLEGSPYRDRFDGGLFTHSFLGPQDFHRFHAPVRGTVLECRAIQGNVYLDVTLLEDPVTGQWRLDAPDGAGYEFTQTRGLIIMDSPVGLVATLPIGMAQVSSVNMTAVEGAYLNKGDEFGYFMFGGSDIIMLFEASSDVVINNAPGIHYNCGMGVAEVHYG